MLGKDSGGINVVVQTRLIIMAKHPTPGEVKTRLTPSLTPEEAAGLYVAFTDDCVAQSIGDHWQTHLVIHPARLSSYFDERYPEVDGVHPQTGDDLSNRMQNAFSLFLPGSGPVLMRSSDSPCMSRDLIQEATLALHADADAVISADQGGGYALIGLKELQADLFNIEMSTPSVFNATVDRMQQAGLRVRVLDSCRDVNLMSDLEDLKQTLETTPELCPATAAWLRRR